MLNITINPNFFPQHGGVTLSGSVSNSSATVEWRYTDEVSFNSKGVTQNGQAWSLDLIFASNRDTIIIHAVDGVQLSNNLSIDLSTRAAVSIEPSFQFNEFDELGVSANLDRIPGEDNIDFKNRIIDVYTNPGNSSRNGLSNGSERELGLPHLDPLFLLSVRWNPITNKAYKDVYVDFSKNRVSVQLQEFVIRNELIEVDPVTSTFKTNELVGSEFPEDNNVIFITNGDKPIPPFTFRQIEDAEFFLDITHPDIDISKKLFITYPYKKIEKYKFIDELTGEVRVKNLLEIKQFLEEIGTVVDEFSNTVPIIVWNNGALGKIDSLPDGATSENRETIEQAFNIPPATGNYIKITGVIPEEFYEYTNPFVAKAFFKATQIIDTFLFKLNTTPTKIKGSWIGMNEFHDKNFRGLLETIDDPTSSRNIVRYATELRDITRMGMSNALVNHDYWGSDAPDIIGDTFIPSYFDGGLHDYKILSDGGNIINISLNRRKYLARYIASSTGV